MSTLTTVPKTGVPEKSKTQMPSYAQGPGWRHFWLRRIHSLLGIFFGGYVAIHLLVNATAFSPITYQRNVDKIHDLEPMLPAIEILFIFLPLLVHLVYGIYITFQGVNYNTTTHYNYGGNVRYVLQRITAVILIFFVLYHIITLHRWGLNWFNPANQAYQSTVKAIQTPTTSMAANYALWVFYLLGVWSAVFHFANGLWTGAITWGLTTTAAAQRRWGNVCLWIGIFLILAGTAALAAFTVAGDARVPFERGKPHSTWTKTPEGAAETHEEQAGGHGSESQPATQK